MAHDLVSLAAIAVLLAVIVALVGLLRSQQRAHARREDLLVNQLLHAVGRDWQPAPADAPRDRDKPATVHVIASPEQYLPVG